MPHYRVDIRGDTHRAMGLLAKQGIQNIIAEHERTKRVTARLSSDSPEGARGHVLAALCGEAFTIEDVQLEE
jgi:hypothetical protein